MVEKLLFAWLTASLFIASAVAFAALTPGASPSAQAQETETVLAIDVGDVSGNTATTVGTVNTCFQTTPGQSYVLDVVVEDVTDLVSSQFTLGFPGAVTLQSLDDSLLSHPSPAVGSAAFDLESTDPVPDVDGQHDVSVSNVAALNSGGASGSGTLVRFTMTAPSTAGVFDLTLSNTSLDDSLDIPHTPSGATLAVGTPCPSPPPSLSALPATTGASPGTGLGGSPTPAASNNVTNDGLPLATWIILGLGGAAIVGAGVVTLGLALRRRLAGRP